MIGINQVECQQKKDEEAKTEKQKKGERIQEEIHWDSGMKIITVLVSWN